jgi:micrococcal nuclease
MGTGECYSRAAAKALRLLIPAGSAVTLEPDPRLDAKDRYGRLLRYVRRGGLNANLEMVRRGAAAPWFYEGDRGRYATQLMRLATAAKNGHLGLWGACPGTALDPTRAIDTGSAGARPAQPPPPPPGSGGGSDCDPSYVGVCIPSPPPDLDCGEISFKRFTVRHDVPNPDPHGFDGDRDGIGCET